MIHVKQLSKLYGEFKAIQNVNFEMEKNKIYGLLGRNGAGKTTLMKLLTAQIFPTSGEIEVFGESPEENAKVLQQICFIKESQKYPQNFCIFDALKVSEAIFPNWDEAYAYTLIKDFNLPIKKKIKNLSRGMQSAVGIVIGLASRAPLTIFDEPYLGLDAVARGIFYERLMEDYAEHPRTVILSTHLIDEVSNLLEHILIVDNGQIIIDEEADSLRGKAFTVTGQKVLVEEFLNGKEVVHRESFGGLLSATIIQSGNNRIQVTSGLEISPVSLQQLVVHITKKEGVRV